MKVMLQYDHGHIMEMTHFGTLWLTIINYTPWDKIKSNFKHNATFFIQE